MVLNHEYSVCSVHFSAEYCGDLGCEYDFWCGLKPETVMEYLVKMGPKSAGPETGRFNLVLYFTIGHHVNSLFLWFDLTLKMKRRQKKQYQIICLYLIQSIHFNILFILISIIIVIVLSYFVVIRLLLVVLIAITTTTTTTK